MLLFGDHIIHDILNNYLSPRAARVVCLRYGLFKATPWMRGLFCFYFKTPQEVIEAILNGSRPIRIKLPKKGKSYSVKEIVHLLPDIRTEGTVRTILRRANYEIEERLTGKKSWLEEMEEQELAYQRDPLSRPIDLISFPVIHWQLERAGLKTLGDLVAISPGEFVKRRILTPRTLLRLQAGLAKYGVNYDIPPSLMSPKMRVEEEVKRVCSVWETFLLQEISEENPRKLADSRR